MRLRVSSLIVLLWLAVAPGFAISAVQTDDPLKQIAASSIARGQFNMQRRLVDLPFPLISSGEYVYWRDEGLYWATTHPLFQATTFKTDRVVEWRDSNQPVEQSQSSNPSQRYISQVLLAIFSADFAEIERIFELQLETGAEQWSLQLTPLEPLISEQLKAIVLSGSSSIQTIDIEMGNGDRSHIELTEADVDGPISQLECQRLLGAQCSDEQQ